jgi:UDP-3-O-[3-hydroxymyristoyl] glucosamine N-acyltransferase
LGVELRFSPALSQSDEVEADPKALAQLQLERLIVRSRMLENVSSIAEASASSLVFTEEAQTLSEALVSKAGAILLPPSLIAETGEAARPAALLIASQPRLAFAQAAILLRRTQPYQGVHSSAQIARDAQIGARVTIGALAVIESGARIGQGSEIGAGAMVGAGAVVGSNCRIYPRAVLYSGTVLGDRVVVHAGAVLGADGFGYVRDQGTGAYRQFPQQGRLVIEDDVEIGANSTIDRGALAETRIGRGTKLDNLVHVGHNVKIGADVVIAAQTGISGSSTIGDGAVIAGQVGIADHVEIGPGAILGAQCGVPSRKRLRGAGVLFWGTPARPITQYLKELAMLARLTRGRRGAGSTAIAGSTGIEEGE